MVRAASALSTHPVAAIALGEAAGQVIEALDGAPPTLVLAAVTPPHLGTLEDVGSALQVLLAPDVVIGAVSSAVVGGRRHVEAEPALALFALAGVPAAALSLEPASDGHLLRRGRLEGAAAAVVLGDPFSCPETSLLAALGDLPAAGGLVGAKGQGVGGSRLLLDGRVRTSGAVGALLGQPARPQASQGWTPVGAPWVVTRAYGHVVAELGGRPAAARRSEALGGEPQPAALGVLQDEHVDEPGRADLLAVPVVGSAPGGGLRLARPVPLGRLVRFLRTGPVEVEADLVAALRRRGQDAARAAGPLKGVLLFPGADRVGDADLLAELVGCPVAGVGVTAPLAPVGGVPALHGPGATALVTLA